MAQRAIVERQRRIHGVLPTGRIIPVICGAETDPLGDPNVPDPAAAGGDGLGNGATGGSTDPAAAAGSTPRVYTQEELDAITRRMQAADRTANEYKTKLTEYENAGKTELEREKTRAQELEARASKAEQDLLDMRIHNAFLTSNKYTWQNPAAALRLVDLSQVTVDAQTGDVTGLDAAIEALSKSDPYLLKPQDGKPSGNAKPASSKASGSNPSANGGNGGRGEDRAALLKKYPQLRR